MSAYFSLSGSNVQTYGEQTMASLTVNDSITVGTNEYTNRLIPASSGKINGVNITALNARTRTSAASAVEAVSTWTTRTSAADNNWYSVCWAPELSLFVAVANTGTGNRVMTSPDGIAWTTRTSAADNGWRSVCWAPELSSFVAVAITGTGNRVMTSPDGVAWTTRTSAADNQWLSVCWAPELSLFVAVANSGTGNRVMTSPDGIAWTARTSAADNDWFSVCWAPELSLFVAVATTGTGNRVMTSPDGVAWTARTSAADNQWRSVCWAPELSLFVAVATSGTGNRVMTSAIAMPNAKSVVKALPSQMMVTADGKVGIGTTNPQYNIHVYGTSKFQTNNGLIVVSENNSQSITYKHTGLTTNGGGWYADIPSGSGIFRFLSGTGGVVLNQGATAWSSAASDQRIKENIKPLSNALDVISTVEPCTYNFKEDSINHWGFIAQDIEKVLPSVIIKNIASEQYKKYLDGDDTVKTYNSEFLIPYLWKAIKEQQIEINNLKGKLESLIEKFS